MAGNSNSSTLQTAKAELVDLQSEQQREMEGLLDNVRSMTRELRLQMLAIDSFVPADYQVRISIKGGVDLCLNKSVQFSGTYREQRSVERGYRRVAAQVRGLHRQQHEKTVRKSINVC